jgi:hypothetical protein
MNGGDIKAELAELRQQIGEARSFEERTMLELALHDRQAAQDRLEAARRRACPPSMNRQARQS